MVLIVLSRAPETQQVVRSFPAVVDYAQRIHNRYFQIIPRWSREAVC